MVALQIKFQKSTITHNCSIIKQINSLTLEWLNWTHTNFSLLQLKNEGSGAEIFLIKWFTGLGGIAPSIIMSLASNSQELTRFLFVASVDIQSGFTMVMFICCPEMQTSCQFHIVGCKNYASNLGSWCTFRTTDWVKNTFIGKFLSKRV